MYKKSQHLRWFLFNFNSIYINISSQCEEISEEQTTSSYNPSYSKWHETYFTFTIACKSKQHENLYDRFIKNKTLSSAFLVSSSSSQHEILRRRQQHLLLAQQHKPSSAYSIRTWLCAPITSPILLQWRGILMESLRTKNLRKKSVFPSLLKILRPPPAPAAVPAERPAAQFASLHVSPPPPGLPAPLTLLRVGPPGTRSSRSSPSPSAPCRPPRTCPRHLAPTRLQLHGEEQRLLNTETRPMQSLCSSSEYLILVVYYTSVFHDLSVRTVLF